MLQAEFGLQGKNGRGAMLNIDIQALKSDEKLLERLKKAVKRKMTEEERYQQMLSFIASGLDDDNITYEDIEQLLKEIKP